MSTRSMNDVAQTATSVQRRVKASPSIRMMLENLGCHSDPGISARVQRGNGGAREATRAAARVRFCACGSGHRGYLDRALEQAGAVAVTIYRSGDDVQENRASYAASRVSGT